MSPKSEDYRLRLEECRAKAEYSLTGESRAFWRTCAQSYQTLIKMEAIHDEMTLPIGSAGY